MAFTVLLPVTGAQKNRVPVSAWKYEFLNPCSRRGVSMVAGGVPTGTLRFQVVRSIMYEP